MSEPAINEPYKGIEPYAEADRTRFFGRAEECRAVISQLYGPRLTIFYGASGVGKTSLLRAGVLPELRKTPQLAVVIFREWQGPAFKDKLHQAILTATLESLNDGQREPVSPEEFRHGLKSMLQADQESVAGEPMPPVEGEARPAVAASPLDALTLSALILLCCQAIDGRVFCIFDQFEEYFLYHPPNVPGNAFESQLAEVIRDKRVPASFLFSLREDGLSKIDRLKGSIPGLLGNLFRLEHLTENGAREAISKPIELYNAARPADQQVIVEPSLALALVNDIKPGQITSEQTDVRVPDLHRSAGDGTRVETAYLQMVLDRLWLEQGRLAAKAGEAPAHPVKRELGLALYTSLGRAKGIVQGYVAEAMETGLERLLREDGLEGEPLSERVKLHQERSAKLFMFLVTSSGSKYAPSLNTLIEMIGYTEQEVQDTLNMLSRLRLVQYLRSDTDDELDARYQVKHDILASAIRIWRDKYIQEASAAKALRKQQRALDAEKQKLKEQEDRLQEKLRTDEAEAKATRAEARRQAAELQLKTAEVERREQEIRAADALARNRKLFVGMALLGGVLCATTAVGLHLASLNTLLNTQTRNAEVQRQTAEDKTRLSNNSLFALSIRSIVTYSYDRFFPEFIPSPPPPPQLRYLLLTSFQAVVRAGQLKCPPEALLSIHRGTRLVREGADLSEGNPTGQEFYKHYLPDFLSPTQNYYVNLKSKGQWEVRPTDTLATERTLGAATDHRVLGAGFNPKGELFGARFDDQSIVVWEIRTGKQVNRISTGNLAQVLGVDDDWKELCMHEWPDGQPMPSYGEVRDPCLSEGIIALGILLRLDPNTRPSSTDDELKEFTPDLQDIATVFKDRSEDKDRAAATLLKATASFLPLTPDAAAKILETARENKLAFPKRPPPPYIAPPSHEGPGKPPPDNAAQHESH